MLPGHDRFHILDALGWWALWAFCSHVMFARTLPVPYGALVTYSSAFLFLIVFKLVLPALGMGKKPKPSRF